MKIKISGEFIKLGQLLKKIGVITSGGKAKHYVKNHTIKVNGVVVTNRGKKIKLGDTVWIDTKVFLIV